jgi:hypothetical protein
MPTTWGNDFGEAFRPCAGRLQDEHLLGAKVNEPIGLSAVGGDQAQGQLHSCLELQPDGQQLSCDRALFGKDEYSCHVPVPFSTSLLF